MAALALLWAIAWTLGGVALGLYRLKTDGVQFDVGDANPRDSARFLVLFALAWGGIGAINGATFAGILGALGRRSGLNGLNLAKIAKWGALAGIVLPVAFIAVVAATADEVFSLTAMALVIGAGAALGTLCALGTFALAGGVSRSRDSSPTRRPPNEELKPTATPSSLVE